MKSLFCVLILALVVVPGKTFGLEIRGVPFVKQAREQCGPAALASVLSFHGVPVDPDSIAEAVYCPNLKGSLITDLEGFARRKGLRTESGQGTLEQMQELLNRQKPVIVLVDLGFWLASKPHYLVLVGYGEQGFVAHDGVTPSKVYPYSKFRRTWERMGSVYLLVYR